MRPGAVFCFCLLIAWLLSDAAFAYQIETAFTQGCHERISAEAVADVGWPDGQPAPAINDQQRRLSPNLPFFAEGMDSWTMALVIGVRDNDLHGNDTLDFARLGAVHQSELFQEEHCLRAPHHDGADGDAQALRACRDFILAEVALALGPADAVQVTTTMPVRVALVHETLDLNVSRFAFHMGRALHALQDVTTHAVHDDDTGRVQTVLNYVDPATALDYRVERDGIAHQSTFDDCSLIENESRVARARDHSAALLVAVGSGLREERLLQAQSVLEDTLVRDEACVPKNDWCGASEALPQGCSTVAGPQGAALLACIGALLCACRRRKSPHGTAVFGPMFGSMFGPMLVPMLVALHSGTAFAADAAAAAARSSSLEVVGRLGGSIDNGAFAASVGAQFRAAPPLLLGVEAEFNPWFDPATLRFDAGTANVLLMGGYDWLSVDAVKVHSSAGIGLAMLLFDAASARRFDVGPIAAINLLGVTVPVTSSIAVEVNPLGVVLAAPHIGGIPLIYRQYRASVGLAFAL